MQTSPPLKSDILLVTVTAVEGKAVSSVVRQQLGQSIKPVFGEKSYFDLGEIGGARVLWMQTGMGSSSIDGSYASIEASIRELSPSAVIMLGIAFGLNPQKQAMGDILVSRQLLLYELQRVGMKSNAELVIRSRGDRVTASSRLLDRFRTAQLNWHKAPVHFGLILSGDKLVDHIEFRQQLQELEPEAIGGEMEGAGLYVAAQNHKVDWIVVKAISDWADGHKNQDRRSRQQQAARNAARFVFHTLAQGGLAPHAPIEAVRATQTSQSPEPHGPAVAGKFKIEIHNSNNIAVGDNSQITMSVAGKPRDS